MAIDAFFGLHQAASGLRTAQRNLSVINHNISNATTVGYSRQQTIQLASEPLYSYDGSGAVGTGVEVSNVERVRDDYLDFKYWSEVITQGEGEARYLMLSDIEAIFNEPSDSGFNTTINNFYESLQELTKDPASDAVRSVVRENAVTLAKYFNSTASHLEKIQEDINSNLKTKVEEVNSYAVQIAELNRQIYSEELNGNIANDLRDRRTALVDKMAKVVNLEAKEVYQIGSTGDIEKKQFIITISGKAIVDNYDVSKLKLEVREDKLNPNEDVKGLYELSWADGNKIELKGGEIKGYMDTRDGNEGENDSPNFKGVPYYIKKLNNFVRTFAISFNEGYVDRNNDGVIQTNEDGIGHVDGYKKGSIEGDKPGGIRLFTCLDSISARLNSNDFLGGADRVEDNQTTTGNETIAAIIDKYNQITAKNISVSQDLFDSYDNITVSNSAQEEGNIIVLNNLLALRHDKGMFAEGAPEDFMKSLVSTLGIDTQQAKRITINQENIVNQIENRRQSVSGVSIDEEMANLVKHQHVYNASAKMITTMQELYDTLINRTGV